MIDWILVHVFCIYGDPVQASSVSSENMLVDNFERSFEPNKMGLFSSFCDYPCPSQSSLIRTSLSVDVKPSGNSFSIEAILGKRPVPERGKSECRLSVKKSKVLFFRSSRRVREVPSRT